MLPEFHSTINISQIIKDLVILRVSFIFLKKRFTLDRSYALMTLLDQLRFLMIECRNLCALHFRFHDSIFSS